MSYLHERLLGALRRAGHDRPHGGRPRRGARSRRAALRVAIAFADLAGYARLTVERGDEAALGTVERFVEAVEQTLPADARVIKTLGDEVMVVGPDAAALAQLGGRAAGRRSRRASRRRGSASTTARRSTATATTTGARSTRRRAWSRARAAARCSSRGRSSTLAAGVDGAASSSASARCGLKGFSEPTELFIASDGRGRSRVVSVERGPRGGARRRAARGDAAAGRGDALRRARLGLPARRRASRCAAPARCSALHVNYGLREEADADERHCARCASGSASSSRSCAPSRRAARAAARGAGAARGNLQAWAREVRYARGRAPRRARATR